jgi:hypothetical protein
MHAYEAALTVLARWILEGDTMNTPTQHTLFQHHEDLPLFQSHYDDLLMTCSKCGGKFWMSESAWQAYAPDDPEGEHLLCQNCYPDPVIEDDDNLPDEVYIRWRDERDREYE